MTDFTQQSLLVPFKVARPGEVKGLHSFGFIPDDVIERLAEIALDENWGPKNFVLEKYMAEHIPLSLAQGRFSYFDGQLIITAGSLQTRYGTPLYLVFEENRSGQQPWMLRAATERPRAANLPQPPDLPEWPPIALHAEVVIAHEHILEENRDRVAFLNDTPPVAQMCAVAGAIEWSIHRNLAIRQIYFGELNYFVPVYLTSREDVTATPDLVAPVQVQPGYLVARTLLEPHMAYPRARVVATRADQLPSWLIRAWHDRANEVRMESVESEPV